MTDEEFTEALRALLQALCDINRALRGHDPYTPEPPPRAEDLEAFERFRRQLS